jgi:hypothetical protein
MRHFRVHTEHPADGVAHADRDAGLFARYGQPGTGLRFQARLEILALLLHLTQRPRQQ